MESSLYSTIEIGPVALLLALVLLPAGYVYYRLSPEPKGSMTLASYIGGALGMGAATFVAGVVLGVTLGCLPTNAGNLCGLVGIFGLGPLFAALGIASMVITRTKKAIRS